MILQIETTLITSVASEARVGPSPRCTGDPKWPDFVAFINVKGLFEDPLQYQTVI